MTTSETRTNRASAVFVVGDVDYDRSLDDEVEVFHVFVGDDDAEPIGRTYTVWRGRDAAESLGAKIARDRHLELVIE